MTDDDREGIEPEDDSQAGDPAAAFEALRRTIEKQGATALAAGLHPITVVWFNKTGGAELKLRRVKVLVSESPGQSASYEREWGA